MGTLFDAQPVLQDFLSLIMRLWNVIADTLHSSNVFLPLLLEDDRGISPSNDWATGFLRGMEFHKEQWAALLVDEEHGGWLVPIFALAHEHAPDPEMRPYKEAIGAEKREKLIVGAAAGVTGIYHYFQKQRLVEKQPSNGATTSFDDTLRDDFVYRVIPVADMESPQSLFISRR